MKSNKYWGGGSATSLVSGQVGGAQLGENDLKLRSGGSDTSLKWLEVYITFNNYSVCFRGSEKNLEEN